MSTSILPSVVYYKNVSSLNCFPIKLQIKQEISKNFSLKNILMENSKVLFS